MTCDRSGLWRLTAEAGPNTWNDQQREAERGVPNARLGQVIFHASLRKGLRKAFSAVERRYFRWHREELISELPQPATAIAERRSRLAVSLWWFMLLSCIGVAVYAARYRMEP